MTTRAPRVGRYVTPCSQTITRDQRLVRAKEVMHARDLRYLPVLDAGKLVGILSARDLYFIETLREVDPDGITVEDAMSHTPFVVTADTPLEEVAEAMSAHDYCCAVVTDAGRVLGVFTASDGMRALASLLHQPRHSDRPRRDAA